VAPELARSIRPGLLVSSTTTDLLLPWQYLVLMLAMLAMFVVLVVLGLIYQSVIPAHFEDMYSKRFIEPRWNELFGVMTYAEVQGQVETNIMMVVVSCSMAIDGLVRHSHAHMHATHTHVSRLVSVQVAG
jgi:hypothetical protein